MEAVGQGVQEEAPDELVRGEPHEPDGAVLARVDGIVLGQSTRAIAQALGTSSRTVDVHRRKLMARLNARSVADLVRLSLQASP